MTNEVERVWRAIDVVTGSVVEWQGERWFVRRVDTRISRFDDKLEYVTLTLEQQGHPFVVRKETMSGEHPMPCLLPAELPSAPTEPL